MIQEVFEMLMEQFIEFEKPRIAEKDVEKYWIIKIYVIF